MREISSPLDGFASPFGGIKNPFAAYNIGGQTPQTLADFSVDKYRGNGASTTAASLLTHTRASTATYVDSTGTVQTAATNELRKDNHIWDGSAWVKRCLVEPQSTNVFLQSEDLTVSPWNINRSTISDNGDGSFTLTQNATDFVGALGQTMSYGASEATAITWDVKAGTASWAFIRESGSDGSANDTYFNLATGAVGQTDTNHTAFVEPMGNGWYRISIVVTNDGTARNAPAQIFLARADGGTTSSAEFNGSTLLIRRPQFEVSPVPTSYIPTAGSQVTRAADALSIDSTLLPYDSTAMTIAMDGEMTYADTDSLNEVQFAYWEDDSLNLIYIRLRGDLGTGGLQFGQADAGTFDSVTQTSSYSPGINVPFNIASRHTSSDINGAVDGTALTANTTVTALPDLSATDFEIAPTGVVNIKSLRILGGYGATDAELEAATT